MDIEYLKLIKIDHDNNSVEEEPLNEEGNVRDYVMDIINQIAGNAGDRRYEFKETEMTMRNLIDDIINDVDRDGKVLAIAQRLLQKENAAQQRYHNITEIQKGILLVAYCSMTDGDDCKMVICKADYTEFIEETTGEKKNGLPTKKKIFKSFAANVLMNAEGHEFGDIVTFDVNAKQSKYWYDEFLDLAALRDNEENTEKAFNTIKVQILDKVKKNNRSDYLALWNLTVGYMRSEGEFDIVHYADNILATYQPVGEALNMNDLADKSKGLPERFHFDNRFEKVPSKIKAKLKTEIKLTDDIDLVLKDNVPNLDRTIRAGLGNDGTKYIMIRSDDGFTYAEHLGGRVENIE